MGAHNGLTSVIYSQSTRYGDWPGPALLGFIGCSGVKGSQAHWLAPRDALLHHSTSRSSDFLRVRTRSTASTRPPTTSKMGLSFRQYPGNVCRCQCAHPVEELQGVYSKYDPGMLAGSFGHFHTFSQAGPVRRFSRAQDMKTRAIEVVSNRRFNCRPGNISRA